MNEYQKTLTDVMKRLSNEMKVSSNYIKDQLDMTVQDWESLKCHYCDGIGWVIYSTSPDGDKDSCFVCKGNGYVDPEQDKQFSKW